MSIESAKAFVEKIQNNEEFKNKVAALENKKARLEFVRNEGFNFTKEEFESVEKLIPGSVGVCLLDICALEW